MAKFDRPLMIPDLWQQEAFHALRDGLDAIVSAPTGAGKTHVFEMLVETGDLRGQAVYTVPTRALANDKLREWRARGWNVGIATGDIADNLGAPVLVATLETQRARFLAGDSPALLVVDEFQMLGDPRRGVNYELTLALAAPHTRLLLLSGSVGNPDTVARWLESLGREVLVVTQTTRPVPLDEVYLDKLPDRVPAGIHGTTVRRIVRALLADLGPLLVFAPRRQAAEDLARALAGALPLNDLLDLSPDQKAVAGDPLGRMLRSRIAFHHSGLSYEQRAGLVEPLAKAGQLRVVVATTGLASGINFSMRSVFVTDRHYRTGHEDREVRPDELLQMFGRAGRRGLDERGYILFAEHTPRLAEAKPLSLKRSDRLDWAGFLAVMRGAADAGRDPADAALALADKLFSREPVRLGLDNLAEYARRVDAPGTGKTTLVRRMENKHGGLERPKPESRVPLRDAWLRLGDDWHPALTRPETLALLPVGSTCKLPDTRPARYGRLVALARFPQNAGDDRLTLAPWLKKALRESPADIRNPDTGKPGKPGKPGARARRPAGAPPPAAYPLEWFEKTLPALLPRITGGGRLHGALFPQGPALMARLDYADALVKVRVDDGGHPLVNPRFREEAIEDIDIRATAEGAQSGSGLPADIWLRLGLITPDARPTRRGVIAGFFQQSEGLAIAAALEDDTYAIPELVRDLANLRAGHRFEGVAHAGNRLGAVCRMTYRGMTCPGYLREGVPPDYGDGAAETIARYEANPAAVTRLADDLLRPGDIERARIEWLSLLNHLAHAPDLDWDRWQRLKAAARTRLALSPPRATLAPLPALPGTQHGRHAKRTRY